MTVSAKIALLTGGVFLSLAGCSVGYATQKSIAGYWTTYDKLTKRPTSVIQIWKSKGKYFGKIAKIYPVKGANARDLCVDCKGELRNRPVLGLPIIKNVVQKGDQYDGGKILDPRSGKEYQCIFTLNDEGDTLKVRGYIGMPLFGQTDTWRRAVNPAAKKAN